MKSRSRAASLLVVLAVLISLLAGCGQTPAPAPDSTPPPAAAAPAPENPPETPAPDEAAPEAETREITDMAGRTMTVPAEIEKIYSDSPISAIYLYTLVPDKLLGWNYELNDIEKSVILEKYHSLPNFGMGDAVNYEAVIAAGPDVAFSVTKISDGTADGADELAEKLGVPVIVVSNDLKSAPEVYRFMGEVFGVEEQAEKLAAYAEKTFNDISGMEIPEEEKIRIYYGNGETSLETAPNGSAHAQIIDLVNAVNVADLELGDGSCVQISKEQLLAWDPDVIIVNGEPKSTLSGGAAAQALMDDPDLATVKAVQNGMVFGAPNAPFSWVDRPPGPNRIIGMRWLACKIYPDYFDFDVDEEVREFFSLFYHVELTDEQLAEVYNGYA